MMFGVLVKSVILWAEFRLVGPHLTVAF